MKSFGRGFIPPLADIFLVSIFLYLAFSGGKGLLADAADPIEHGVVEADDAQREQRHHPQVPTGVAVAENGEKPKYGGTLEIGTGTSVVFANDAKLKTTGDLFALSSGTLNLICPHGLSGVTGIRREAATAAR